MLKLPNKMVDGQPTKQDADDFIKNFGPDAFERLLSGSENGIEFRIAEVAGKFDLSDDRQRVAYAEEVSGVLAGLENAVEREIYTCLLYTSGLRTECQCRYRPWPYVEHSPQRELTNRIAQETFGYTLREEVCPGGLEIGYFFTCADFDAVMLGPNMKHWCS